MAAKNRTTSRPALSEFPLTDLADELHDQYMALSGLEILCEKAGTESEEFRAVKNLLAPITDSLFGLYEQFREVVDAREKAAS